MVAFHLCISWINESARWCDVSVDEVDACMQKLVSIVPSFFDGIEDVDCDSGAGGGYVGGVGGVANYIDENICMNKGNGYCLRSVTRTFSLSFPFLDSPGGPRARPNRI